MNSQIDLGPAPVLPQLANAAPETSADIFAACHNSSMAVFSRTYVNDSSHIGAYHEVQGHFDAIRANDAVVGWAATPITATVEHTQPAARGEGERCAHLAINNYGREYRAYRRTNPYL